MKYISLIAIFFVVIKSVYSQESSVTETTIAETNEYSLYAKKFGNLPVTIQRSDLDDTSRNRSIPIIMYHPKIADSLKGKMKVVILSHGYGFNSGKPYLGYSFIANHLASKGYFVVSVQHEVPTDDSLALDGPNLKELRMPNWEKGVKNISYVIKSIQSEFDFVDTTGITLIGHSNGGDMSLLYAEKYPQNVVKIITLDNRRMPIPRTEKPMILSIRSSDQIPDEGVIPSIEECEKYKISIANMSNMLHNDMCNNASAEQKADMLYIIDEFIKK